MQNGYRSANRLSIVLNNPANYNGLDDSDNVDGPLGPQALVPEFFSNLFEFLTEPSVCAAKCGPEVRGWKIS
jgi:hypothetical protein